MGNSLSKEQLKTLKQAKIDRKIDLDVSIKKGEFYLIKKTF